ncbi:cerebellar degeneration-related protein 2 isoform X2 [Spea bombifrons]|uniref:cerebellar degeneration-related protein 2 isoform X2 n=1 Tax=Spea bombifrons TaxID=233779 RepID=UPI002349FAF6|nr:cerebellar degeneration-related protein 2 isoform X2 [Spea bombifrons]
MLTDSNVEEFEIKEDEPWYDHQDLQQDLQLAAELGKTLLDRNTELEESLQQMYATNEEQIQEIEYLTKQLDLLRRMNEQHAKVYEQLDITAKELEEANEKLVLENKSSQQKITSLTETIETLQSNMEDLQKQVDDLKKPGRVCRSRERFEQSRSSQSFSCLKELYDLRKYFVYDHVFAEKITSLHSQPGPLEEENCSLKKTLSVLEAQLNLERKRRENLEEEFQQVFKENLELEQVLSDRDSCHARAEELEAQVAEMREIVRTDTIFASSVEKLIPESIFISFKDTSDKDPNQEVATPPPEAEKRPLRRSSSEMVLPTVTAEAILNGHEETCIRRTEAVKQRGISLLNEVDSQYSALKLKYEELLQRCQLEDDDFNHKAVQTAKPSQVLSNVNSPGEDSLPRSPEKPNIGSPVTQPEYKLLFQEIFSCIKKTKEEINEHRTKYKFIPESVNS